MESNRWVERVELMVERSRTGRMAPIGRSNGGRISGSNGVEFMGANGVELAGRISRSN